VTPEAVAAATGWPLRFAETLRETPAPTDAELSVLRELQRRTKEAHSAKAAQ
jgi:glutaconate CoA-transferase subunit B